MFSLVRVKIGFLALTAALLVAGQAQAQPAPAKGIMDVRGTTWNGTENLEGFNNLTFEFQNDGKVVMRDAVGVVNGTYRQEGDMVTIQFNNCVYSGRIVGERLAGTAQSTTGAPATWDFNVSFMPSKSTELPSKR